MNWRAKPKTATKIGGVSNKNWRTKLRWNRTQERFTERKAKSMWNRKCKRNGESQTQKLQNAKEQSRKIAIWRYESRKWGITNAKNHILDKNIEKIRETPRRRKNESKMNLKQKWNWLKKNKEPIVKCNGSNLHGGYHICFDTILKDMVSMEDKREKIKRL